MLGYVAGGWAAAVAMIALYSWRTLHRGRVLSRTLPDEERTWR